MTDARPEGWKNYDDFAQGIATNRLPASDALVGLTLDVQLPDLSLTLRPQSRHELRWEGEGRSGVDWYEAVEVAADTFFVDLTLRDRLAEALTFVINRSSLRVLGIRCRIRSTDEAAGQPRVEQEFLPASLLVAGRRASAEVPAPTRDLIGLRTFQTYSPNHTYEHTYLNSERYAWQCLVGVQRGHGDVDLASCWRFAEGLYVFCFREFLIPVASVFFCDFAGGRSTGKFLGVTGDGSISNSPAGAFITKASMTFYPPETAPL